MSDNWKRAVPTTAASFTAGAMVGRIISGGTAGLHRPLTVGDEFAGVATQTQDRTGGSVGVYSHTEETGLIVIDNGIYPFAPKSGVTPIIGAACYAATASTFSHDPADGVYMGKLVRPWVNHAGYWEIDTRFGVMHAFDAFNLGDPVSATFVPTAGAANICEVLVTMLDGGGNIVTGPLAYDLYLSDAATGVGLTGTTASGTVTAKAASGAVLSTYTAKKDLRVQTLATGLFTLEITDTAKSPFYVCARMPNGSTQVSDALVTADYGV
jgi:hypothetical protein